MLAGTALEGNYGRKDSYLRTGDKKSDAVFNPVHTDSPPAPQELLRSSDAVARQIAAA